MGKPPPARYCTTNWSSYDAALRRRGSMSIWVGEDMAWLAPQEGGLGRLPDFSDAAIQFCHSVEVLSTLPLRQSVEMVASLLRMAGLNRSAQTSAPCAADRVRWNRGPGEVAYVHRTLAVQIPYRRVDGPLNLLVNSAGIEVLGDGEWQARKHGVQGRR